MHAAHQAAVRRLNVEDGLQALPRGVPRHRRRGPGGYTRPLIGST
jgi:hypothetical protein